MEHHIKSRLNGFVLDIPGGKRDNGVEVVMRQASKPPTDSELWHLDNQPDGTFLIISKLHGKALDCGGQTQGSKLIVWDRHGGNNQRWRREGNCIASMSGLVLDIEGSNKEPGAKVCLWTKNQPVSSNQEFDFEMPHHHIKSHLNGYVLDIPGSKRDNGVEVIMYPASSPPTDNQLWKLDYQPDGTFLIISKLHGKALDCGGQTQGSKLVVWDRHGEKNQRWRKEGNYIVSMSGLVLDIASSNKERGAKMCLWSKNQPASSNQQFDFAMPA